MKTQSLMSFDKVRKTHNLCRCVRYAPWRSFKVVEFGIHGKRVYKEFLLMINSNLASISHRF